MPRALFTLLACWGVLFTQYGNVCMLTAFVPDSVYGRQCGSSMVGAIFAVYPLTTALAIPVPPWCMARLGIRLTVCLGLVLVATGSLLCGLLPDLLRSPTATEVAVLMLALRSLCGFGAALAEAGCFTALSTGDYGAKHVGLVMSSCEVVVGVGSACGTAAGGLLSDLGAVHPALGPWRLPFVVSAMASLSLLPFTYALPSRPPTVGGEGGGGDASGGGSSCGHDGGCDECGAAPPAPGGAGGGAAAAVATTATAATAATATTTAATAATTATGAASSASPLSAVCSVPRVVALTSLFLGSAMVEATAPILQPHVAAPPLALSNGSIGLVVALYSLCYTAASLPLGLGVDRLLRVTPSSVERRGGGGGPRRAAFRLKLVVLGGWVGMVASFALLGGGLVRPGSELGTLVGSMVVGGIASAAVVVPSLPELQLGIADDDEPSKAALCSLWNGFYSGGAAAGPFVAAVVCAARGFDFTTGALFVFSLGCAALLAVVAAATWGAARPPGASRRRHRGRVRGARDGTLEAPLREDGVNLGGAQPQWPDVCA